MALRVTLATQEIFRGAYLVSFSVGLPLVVWRDGKIEHISADSIGEWSEE
jgi:hypothetical protein